MYYKRFNNFAERAVCTLSRHYQEKISHAQKCIPNFVGNLTDSRPKRLPQRPDLPLHHSHTCTANGVPPLHAHFEIEDFPHIILKFVVQTLQLCERQV